MRLKFRTKHEDKIIPLMIEANSLLEEMQRAEGIDCKATRLKYDEKTKSVMERMKKYHLGRKLAKVYDNRFQLYLNCAHNRI